MVNKNPTNESKRTCSICRVQQIFAVGKLIKALIFDWRLAFAKRKATRHADLYGRKFLVIVFHGKPVVVSMQGIKRLIRQHRFAKGFTAGKAAELAIFTAMPHRKEDTDVSHR